MGEPDKYVLPVAEDLRQFLSFLLFCRDSNPIAQLWWMEEEQFRSLLEEDTAGHREGCKPFLARRNKALEVIARTFSLAPPTPMLRYRPCRPLLTPVSCVFPTNTMTCSASSAQKGVNHVRLSVLQDQRRGDPLQQGL